ncbi:MAG: 16S rRNA (guanine(527)-N(7))-methyltransferase RsmG [Anaerolineales bacterium]|nr:16S rRNA (guanine(527)-N(7))-methyltransferase RsmG [Anaerolineales bacterium]MCW5856555.1 16S rRNA (guanine(527)-N(7))-methyltransferase RsmG [Anaerolineales bacterium]
MPDFAKTIHDWLGVSVTDEQLAAFDQYAAELAAWNQRFNLTTITELEQVRTRHFLDSLSCWLALGAAPGRLADVGTGAGLPGLPLKILQPGLPLTLIEATAKKAGFLEHMVQVLRLKDVQVLAARAEEAGQLPAERAAYDWAVARALAPLPVLAEYLLPLVRVGGRMLAQKGREAAAELSAAQEAIRLLGGGPAQLLPAEVPGLDEERWLIVVEKVAETPAKYPRRPGMPSKRPLRADS